MRALLATALSGLIAAPALAAENSGPVVTIDGRIDPAEWANASHITDFRQTMPFSGAPGSLPTEAWILATPEGLAVASRWPVTEHPGSIALSHPWRVVHYSRRIAGGVSVATDHGALDVWNTHLSPDGAPARRLAEIRQLLALLPTSRTVLAGDLNVRPGSHELAVLAEAGWTDGHDGVHPDSVVATNLTGDRKRLKQRLDYVLVSRDLVDHVVDARVPGATEPVDTSWWALSDHLPLVVDVELSQPRGRSAHLG